VPALAIVYTEPETDDAATKLDAVRGLLGWKARPARRLRAISVSS
jgi:hypothetical protein